MTLETFLSRHGEAAVHGMLENWERFADRQAQATTTLEERWSAFMSETSHPARSVMA